MRLDLATCLVALAAVFAAVVHLLLGVRAIGPDLDARLAGTAAVTAAFAAVMLRLLRAAEEPSAPACGHEWDVSPYHKTRQCVRCGQRETFRVRWYDPGDGHPHAADWGAM